MEALEVFVGRDDRTFQQQPCDTNFQPVVELPERKCFWREIAERGESYDNTCIKCDGYNSLCSNYSR